MASCLAMLSSILSMAAFALVGAITPGPVNVLALQHGRQGARGRAGWYVLGASLSYVGVVACMGLAAQQAQAWLPVLGGLASWICATYLLYLAWGLAHAPPEKQDSSGDTDPQRHTAWQALLQGTAVQTLNPKAWLFALSAVGVFVLPHGAAAPAALRQLCAISLLACGLGVGCWAVLGRLLMRWLNTPARQRGLNRALAAVLVLSVLAMLA